MSGQLPMSPEKKNLLNPLELELQAAVSHQTWVLEIETESYGRAVNLLS
ncbi:hypothetical protein LEMLEM_LOCUS6480 [Lemmus lemmus]